MANVMNLKRTQIVAMLESAGFSTAKRMKPDQLEKKIRSLPDTLTAEDPLTPEQRTLADTICANLAADAAYQIVIEDDVGKGAVATATAQAAAAPATTPTTDATAATLAGTEPKPKKEPKPKAPKAPKEPKVKEPKAPKEPAPPKEPKRSRPFVCGEILHQFGLENGVTAEMVAAVDAAYGQVNERESAFALRNGLAAIRGYLAAVEATKK